MTLILLPTLGSCVCDAVCLANASLALSEIPLGPVEMDLRIEGASKVSSCPADTGEYDDGYPSLAKTPSWASCPVV